uniref:Uncharacterized protein n=1 Tax=Glossina morsitans morsitans TaxID=37546 RepID=A0A1B0FQ09_GLOMM
MAFGSVLHNNQHNIEVSPDSYKLYQNDELKGLYCTSIVIVLLNFCFMVNDLSPVKLNEDFSCAPEKSESLESSFDDDDDDDDDNDE